MPLSLMIVWGLACRSRSSDTPSPQKPSVPARAVETSAPNVLLVVLDDVGAERVAAYGSPYDAPKTETLTALARDGVRFTRAWSNPLCSPTRATLLTGRYSRRTGIGRIIDSWNDEPELELSEVTLPEILARAPTPYDRSAVGKWHLGSAHTGPEHPLRQGFSWWAGPLGNLRDTYQGKRADTWGYFQWMKSDNGRMREATGYVTTDTADDAIARVSAMQEPWFLYVAFNAAHFPLHTPPEGLGLQGIDDTSPDPDRYDSALVALDRELGRVVAALSPTLRSRTYVFVVGDNGTPDFAIRPPLDPQEAKGSLMELGVHVPLIVTGPNIRGGQRAHVLVNTVDVFSTIAEIAGVNLNDIKGPIDGISFLPSLRDPSDPGARRFAFAEKFDHNGPGPYERVTVAIRDEGYKLVVDRKRRGTVESLHAMGNGFLEGPDLLRRGGTPASQAAYERLSAELSRIEATLPR